MVFVLRVRICYFYHYTLIPGRLDAKPLQIARLVFLEENLKLIGALEKLGARVRPITSGVFSTSRLARKTSCLVGKITKVVASTSYPSYIARAVLT